MVLNGMLGFAPASTSAPLAPDRLFTPSAPLVSETTLRTILIQAVFVLLLILTPIYLRKVANVQNRSQLVVTTLSFVIWVYTLGGPFVVWGLYYPLVASVLLVLWSLTIPLCISATTVPQPHQKGI